jgi:hypothetical protein
VDLPTGLQRHSISEQICSNQFCALKNTSNQPNYGIGKSKAADRFGPFESHTNDSLIRNRNGVHARNVYFSIHLAHQTSPILKNSLA